MVHIKKILMVATVFMLVSCSSGAPTAPISFIPTQTPTMTPAPAPKDVPVYRNSFEAISDLAASGITSSNANVTLETENFNYPGPGTALQVRGTLPGEQFSSLDVDFSILNLTGEASLDLSDKTLNISFFIPSDSPIGSIAIVVVEGNQVVIISGEPGWGWMDDRTGWWDYQLDVAKVYEDGSWAYTNVSDTEAREMIRHCETLSIGGVRSTAGTPTETEFYLDDLRWIGINYYNVPVNDTIDSLRKYTADQHFVLGLWAGYQYVFGDYGLPPDPWYAYTATQEGTVNAVWGFSSMENEDYSVFDYDRPGEASLIQQYNYGYGNSMTIMGYGVGAMYSTAPQWVRDLGFPDATKALMLYQVEKDLRFTQGKNPIWLLFNEFIGGDSTGSRWLRNRQGWGSDYSPWAADETDSSLYKAAFIKAYEVDQNATLLLNDYYDEQIGEEKSEFLYGFASGLKNEGIPIDGVGWQMHSRIDPNGNILVCQYPFAADTCIDVPFEMDTYLNNVDLNVKRYASIGLKVAFTEVEGYIRLDDLDLTSADGRAEYERRLQWQARYFTGLLKIAMDNDNVILYHTWQLTDRYAEAIAGPVPGTEFGNPAIFDKNYNPKPAYYAMLELLKAP
jgi:GH35 family endo-1,4-beta-xylanase